ncbi:uncharacterized protein G2W53_041832 [Senna tora]|uniref:Uncharacterized protein n=1 Tax=Senna tora TaxID=362788 RepID=A0A834SGC3_9FABA|nr:uncharacterized protein G2W53_041832 [Senna tora]
MGASREKDIHGVKGRRWGEPISKKQTDALTELLSKLQVHESKDKVIEGNESFVGSRVVGIDVEEEGMGHGLHNTVHMIQVDLEVEGKGEAVMAGEKEIGVEAQGVDKIQDVTVVAQKVVGEKVVKEGSSKGDDVARGVLMEVQNVRLEDTDVACMKENIQPIIRVQGIKNWKRVARNMVLGQEREPRVLRDGKRKIDVKVNGNETGESNRLSKRSKNNDDVMTMKELSVGAIQCRGQGSDAANQERIWNLVIEFKHKMRLLF